MCCVCNFTALDNLDCQNVKHISRSSRSSSLSSLPSALSCPSLFPGEAGFGPVPPPHHHPQQQQQQQGVAGANIDLGAVYQNTVENRVTRTFSQHWIIVGKHLRLGLPVLTVNMILILYLVRVLLLDFDGKFTLLIPNIELGKAFRINKADVEVQANFHSSLKM